MVSLPAQRPPLLHHGTPQPWGTGPWAARCLRADGGARPGPLAWKAGPDSHAGSVPFLMRVGYESQPSPYSLHVHPPLHLAP